MRLAQTFRSLSRLASSSPLYHRGLASRVRNDIVEPRTEVGRDAKVQGDPDVFGTLSDAANNYTTFPLLGSDPAEICDNDGEEEFFDKLADTGRPRPFDYLKKIEKLLNTRSKDFNKFGAPKLKEALTLFDVEMKKELVKPIPEHFRILIHACGRVGHFEKGMLLYKEYGDRSFPINFGIFADLFNGFAHCPKGHEERALELANRLRKDMQGKCTYIPKVVYHTMIKAYGRCGDLETAFDILDEMKEKRLIVDCNTINHVLHGCIADKIAGFRHALIVWRRMRTKKLKPDKFTYNLMLRTARECDAGPREMFHDLIIESLSTGKEIVAFRKKILEAKEQEPKKSSELTSQSTSDLVVVTDVEKELLNPKVLPNFLAKKIDLKDVYGIGDLSVPENRFQLLGGVTGFLRTAREVDKVQLDIKTYSQILHCIDNNLEAEEQLLSEMRALGVKTDVGFFNQLIRRRVGRLDYENGRQTLDILSNEFGLSPDILTFGCLALCCDSLKSSFEFLAQMRSCGFHPNIETFNGLLSGAARRQSPYSMAVLLQEFPKFRLQADARTIGILETFHRTYQAEVRALERGMTDVKPAVRKSYESENGPQNWKMFLDVYDQWLRKTAVDSNSHPWEQFLTDKDYELTRKGSLAFQGVIKND